MKCNVQKNNNSAGHSFYLSHLCKILLRDASGPFYAELLRPAWIGDVCTLNQHPLDKDAILGGCQNAFDRLFIIVSLQKKEKESQTNQRQIISTKTSEALLPDSSAERQQPDAFKNNWVCA